MRKIGRGEDTEKLYLAEAKASEALGAAARRLEEVLIAHGLIGPEVHHYMDVRPEAIFTLLESQESGAALVACLAFLDWYRANRQDVFRRALADWETQRANACPVCEGSLPHA
jgi:hypothetical protein